MFELRPAGKEASVTGDKDSMGVDRVDSVGGVASAFSLSRECSYLKSELHPLGWLIFYHWDRSPSHLVQGTSVEKMPHQISPLVSL